VSGGYFAAKAARGADVLCSLTSQMNIRDAILIVLFANLLSAVVIVLNSRAAAKYHLGFPALARASFGTYGSYFYILLRSILGIIWVGI
jgi:NCS1 family nucleobase:cation symporter-1